MLSRRDFLAASSAAALPSHALAAQRRRPNVIVFLTDDMGCQDLGCLGSHDLRRPTSTVW